MRQAFRKAGVAIGLTAVHDGEDALAYLRGEGAYADRTLHPLPHALLLDLNMPRMNGFEVLSALRADPLWDGLAIYVLSASNLPADIRLAHRLRANGYLVKPNRVDELVSIAGALQAWLRLTVHLPAGMN